MSAGGSPRLGIGDVSLSTAENRIISQTTQLPERRRIRCLILQPLAKATVS